MLNEQLYCYRNAMQMRIPKAAVIDQVNESNANIYACSRVIPFGL